MKKLSFVLSSMIMAPAVMAASIVSTTSVVVDSTGIIVTGKKTPLVFVNKGFVKNGKRTFWIDVPYARNVTVKPEVKKNTRVRNIKTGGYRIEMTVDDSLNLTSFKNTTQRIFSLKGDTNAVNTAELPKAPSEMKANVIVSEKKSIAAPAFAVTNVVLGPNVHDDTDRLIFKGEGSFNINDIKLNKKSEKEWIVDFGNNINIPDILVREQSYPYALTIDKTTSFINNGRRFVSVKFKSVADVTVEKSSEGFVLAAHKNYEADALQNKKNYTGRKVTLNFQKIDVRALLQVIAEFTNLNIIASEKVTGDITLALKDVPWDQALDMILQTKGLDMRKNGNVIWVGARDEIAAADTAEANAQNQKELALPLISESIQINYQKAADVATLITNGTQKLLSARGTVTTDKMTNTIFIRDNSERLQEIKSLLKRIDIPARQVMISAKIIETEVGAGKTLGAKFGFGSTGRVNNNGFAIGSGLSKTGTVAQGQAGGPVATNNYFQTGDGLNVNLPATGLSSGATNGTFALSLFNSAWTKFISLEVSAMEAENKSKSVSSPQVLAIDNVESTLSKGTEIPYQEASSSGATSTSFKQAGLSLKVKPQITPDGSVSMEIDLNNGVVGQTTSAGPSINNTNLKTTVRIQDGGTLLIGGVIIEEENNQVNKIPFFGDIPVLGNLFKNKYNAKSTKELNILLTPQIVK